MYVTLDVSLYIVLLVVHNLKLGEEDVSGCEICFAKQEV